MNKLNVNVGDVVKVTDGLGIMLYLGMVAKVLPNGRFMLKGEKDYWRANGTKNTKALAGVKSYRAEKGSRDDYVLKIKQEMADNLRALAIVLETSGNDIGCVNDIDKLNKVIDLVLGYGKSEEVETIFQKIRGKEYATQS